MSEIRMPTQKRSIEKRNRIIQKGFELMCENGYYKTTIPDIANYANVSTGIIYQYFNDKKDIFIEGTKNYSNEIMYPMFDILYENQFELKKIDLIIENLIDKFIEKHTISKKAHEELMAMSHLDCDIAKIFKDMEVEITNKIVSFLKGNNINLINLNEKIHISFGLIETLCHEVIYHKHDEINYEIMKKEVVSIITNILK